MQHGLSSMIDHLIDFPLHGMRVRERPSAWLPCRSRLASRLRSHQGALYTRVKHTTQKACAEKLRRDCKGVSVWWKELLLHACFCPLAQGYVEKRWRTTPHALDEAPPLHQPARAIIHQVARCCIHHGSAGVTVAVQVASSGNERLSTQQRQ